MSLKTTVTRALARQSLKVKKNSPHILFGAGVVSILAGTALACKATLKVEPVLDEIKHDLSLAKDPQADPPANSQTVAYIYGKGMGSLARLYAPAIVVGGGGLLLLTTSHVQLTRRNTALTVAYASLHQAYLEYRDRVRAEVGEEKELDLYHGVTLEQARNEAGKLADFKTIDPNKLSPYARFFDEGSPNWNNNPEYNRIFIQCQQNYMNQLLQARGHVFLNEVYDALGINRSQAGQVVGWVINGDGDNFVDFGLFEAHSQGLVNGHEPSILLDFNVDGVVFDKL